MRKEALTGRNHSIYRTRIGILSLLVFLGVAGTIGCFMRSDRTNRAEAATLGTTLVFAYNDLGMHCINQDFSEIMVLPPFNNLRAVVITRGGEPHIVSSGVTVSYTIPSSAHSADKTNFWDYAQTIFGTPVAPNVGLTGAKLSGVLSHVANTNFWEQRGIPITPIEDNGKENPYPMATVTVKKNGAIVATTQTVVPVSWEMSCNLCHKTPGISTAMDILKAHDRLHGTNLVNQKPVMCAKCHADPALGAAGTPGVPSLSSAMHTAHAPRMASANLSNPCYACHPGIRTKCLRDVHVANGLTCTSCHGDMAAVGAPTRAAWVDEPRCGNCHTRTGFQFEETGKLYKDSRGHEGVMCAACHGSPHAITPTNTAADNVQATAIQGHSGKINTCAVCHIQTPSDSFPHRLGG